MIGKVSSAAMQIALRRPILSENVPKHSPPDDAADVIDDCDCRNCRLRELALHLEKGRIKILSPVAEEVEGRCFWHQRILFILRIQL
jgi:hypothetical protein